MVSYCEEADVRKAMSERNLTGNTQSEFVKPAIKGVSDWFRRQSRSHFYDSGGGTTLVSGSARTASDVWLDVPSSPHTQDRQLYFHEHGTRYPVTHTGPYCKLRLPHRHVTTLSKLLVRESDGDTTDWVASSDFVSGRGEDYYLASDGGDPYGTVYLHIRAASIGPRVDFDDLVTATYDYGLDYQTESWDDVKTGIANLAAAQLATDDDLVTSIPADGQLVNLTTKYDKHVAAALGQAQSRLAPYILRVK